jgi:hypothetical protein
MELGEKTSLCCLFRRTVVNHAELSRFERYPKEIKMNKRAHLLAGRIESGAYSLADFCEKLSDAEWNTVVPNEGRPVGVLVHHVAVSYPVEVDLAQKLASGDAIEGVTWAVIDDINAQHAKDHGNVDKKETLQLLRKNAKAAADRVRDFSDSELDAAAAVSLNHGAPLTAQFFIEDHALRHSFQHFASIRDALS